MREAKHSCTLPLRLSTALAAAATLLASATGAGAQMNGRAASSTPARRGQLNRGVDVSTRDGTTTRSYNRPHGRSNGSVFSNRPGVALVLFRRRRRRRPGHRHRQQPTVSVQGSWNRVTVDSTQINNGEVSAQTSLNGSLTCNERNPPHQPPPRGQGARHCSAPPPWPSPAAFRRRPAERQVRPPIGNARSPQRHPLFDRPGLPLRLCAPLRRGRAAHRGRPHRRHTGKKRATARAASSLKAPR